jgi:ribosomal protein S18 acetylase RimI-like enzyme
MRTDDLAVEIRQGRPDDIDALGVVGPAAYAEAYGYLWRDPRAYLRQLTTFSATAFSRVMGSDGTRLWVATLDGAIVGFLTMRLRVSEPINGADGGAEIARLYILGPSRRLRVGQKLLAAAIDEAVAEGCSHVWLQVMASADWARRAYVRWGFVEIGGTVYTGGVSEGLADMIVMSRPIAGSAGHRPGTP